MAISPLASGVLFAEAKTILVMSYFDTVASEYDKDFTHSIVGQYQRNLIQQEVKQLLSGKNALQILELNCGTGEDASFFNQLGHKVFATDASNEMIEVCKKKHVNSDTLIFEQCRIEEIKLTQNQKFDVVFSNFSGINMLDEEALRKFLTRVPAHLVTNGYLILVFFGKVYLPEFLYYLLKGRWKKAIRRLKHKEQFAGKEYIYYHSTFKVQELLQAEYFIVKSKPVGIVSPPSYLSAWFEKRKWLFNFLVYCDSVLTYIVPGIGSDHCMLIAKKR
ncbi:MAG: class I SAM-dependent methyltransferase [Bacteroidetes bacterium]|nr:class I SAM-dependent methyltransferase [Bacteroidota bacterium]